MIKPYFQMNPLFHSEVDGSCEYLARWKYDENLDKIDFVIKSTNVGKWTGIGFSETPQMVTEQSLTKCRISWLKP